MQMDTVKDVIYWREPINSGIIAAVGLTFLLSLSCMSFISVVAYAGLALFCCTAACKLYNVVLGSNKAEQETSNSSKHSFHSWLEYDILFSEDKIAQRAAAASEHLSEKLNQLRRILLMHDYFETAKLAICLYLLSIVGSWFNLLTLITVGKFTIISRVLCCNCQCFSYKLEF
ncbi:Reticulon-4 isoform 4 [Schistosoma japonicum]|uniref:Reticulon-like protein n=1 Tax=Schistosoma japonicum TaxID=6182 RepID=A0A4Z2DC96_SCHJA|nr:Reticulon-4 isoform 4 [Schistosoma japonicum]